jgi:Gas vesicle synthesis protein GvpL/GvpF
MKVVVIGAHLHRSDIEPLATALPAGDLWLSGVEVADDQPLGDRDLVLRVAKTRAALLERATFVAIRYGFAAGDTSKVSPHLATWRRLLERHRDHVEMTLKVAAAAPRPRPDRRDYTSGAGYLRALHASSAEVDPRFRQAAESRIAAIAYRWSPRDNASVEMAALVRRDDVGRVIEAGQSLKRDFPEVAFLLSGPWPLEVFADDHQ